MLGGYFYFCYFLTPREECSERVAEPFKREEKGRRRHQEQTECEFSVEHRQPGPQIQAPVAKGTGYLQKQ